MFSELRNVYFLPFASRSNHSSPDILRYKFRQNALHGSRQYLYSILSCMKQNVSVTEIEKCRGSCMGIALQQWLAQELSEEARNALRHPVK
jgi:hypothetical protein